MSPENEEVMAKLLKWAYGKNKEKFPKKETKNKDSICDSSLWGKVRISNYFKIIYKQLVRFDPPRGLKNP